MKKVILKRLTLVNFKGEKSRTTVFNPDVTSIYGANGTGKSRHPNAFSWLLFGKDTEDRKDYKVKTIVNGEELHKVECSTTGVLDVDGEEITLKRALVEDWVKPRGQAEHKYKGTHTECWWNDTPVSVTEFNKRVAEIMDSTLFKMITNPEFFARMPWKQQREQLFQMAGTIGDGEIAAMKPEYAALLDKIGGKSFDDFKAEIAAKKKRLKDELAEVQPRIDQTHKMKPQAEDFAAIEKEIADIDKQVAGIDESISSVAAAVKKAYEEQSEKRKRLADLQAEYDKILSDAKAKAQDEAYAANARKRELEADAKAKQKEVEFAKKEVEFCKTKIERLERERVQFEKNRDDLREKWYEENGRVYDGSTVCPHCHQDLPKSMVEEAKAVFNKEKAEKCGEINEKGKQAAADFEKVCNELTAVFKEHDEATKRLADALKKLSAIMSELEPLEDVAVQDVDHEQVPELVSKKQEIEAAKGAFEEVAEPGAGADDLQSKKMDLQVKRGALCSRLAARNTIELCDKEIAKLESDAKRLAQQIADIEKEEFVAQEFTKVRINESEKCINAMFKAVTFQMYEYTIDGNPVETCVPLVAGVPYDSANTAGRINAGIDIINTLCRFYGICAPIFIDNRESVNELMETESQIINLVVSKDKELIVK